MIESFVHGAHSSGCFEFLQTSVQLHLSANHNAGVVLNFIGFRLLTEYLWCMTVSTCSARPGPAVGRAWNPPYYIRVGGDKVVIACKDLVKTVETVNVEAEQADCIIFEGA
jgi:hypothetical protein